MLDNICHPWTFSLRSSFCGPSSFVACFSRPYRDECSVFVLAESLCLYDKLSLSRKFIHKRLIKNLVILNQMLLFYLNSDKIENFCIFCCVLKYLTQKQLYSEINLNKSFTGWYKTLNNTRGNQKRRINLSGMYVFKIGVYSL